MGAFVAKVPANEMTYAAARDATARDKKHRDLRTCYGTNLKEASRSGASRAHKLYAVLKFSGAIVFGMTTAVFEACRVSKERRVREPVVFLRSDRGAGGLREVGVKVKNVQLGL